MTDTRARAGAGKRLLCTVALATLLGVACAEEPPTAPSEIEEPIEGPQPLIENASDLVQMIADIRERVLPAFPDVEARTTLGSTLTRLSAAVLAGATDGSKVPVARVLVTESRAAVMTMRQVEIVANDWGYLAELSAIEIMLDLLSLRLPS